MCGQDAVAENEDHQKTRDKQGFESIRNQSSFKSNTITNYIFVLVI